MSQNFVLIMTRVRGAKNSVPQEITGGCEPELGARSNSGFYRRQTPKDIPLFFRLESL